MCRETSRMSGLEKLQTWLTTRRPDKFSTPKLSGEHAYTFSDPYELNEIFRTLADETK